MGFSSELVNIFIFFSAEDSDEADAFVFFTAACSAALVFFATEAEGRMGLGFCAGGAEKIGSFSSGTTDAVGPAVQFLQAQRLMLQLAWLVPQAQH